MPAPGTALRKRRAARHHEQVVAAMQTTLHLDQVRADWDQADTADADAVSDADRAAAHDAFRARLRAVRSSRARGAAHAAAGRETAARGALSPSLPQGADTGDHHDGGPPWKAESNVAADDRETGVDLGEHRSTSRARAESDKPDLGQKYEQRNNRQQRRMRQLDNLRLVTTLGSLRMCGGEALSGAVAITQKADGSGGFTGVFRCGSVWGCPECAPIIRTDRAKVLEQYALAWSGEHDAERCTGDPADARRTHQPHGMAHATLTSRHGRHARLEDTTVTGSDGETKTRPGQLTRTAEAWRKVLQSRWWRSCRDVYGIVGVTRAIEVTHSWAGGWHTHIHAVLWFERPVTDDVAAELESALYARWELQCRKQGLGRPTRKHGVKVEAARRGPEGAADMAKYLVKVQDKDLEDAGGRAARPTAEQAVRLKDARGRRDRARASRDGRAQAEADSLIASIREEIGAAHRARALGNELLRGDTKVGRAEGRTPFEILRAGLAGTAPERADLAAAVRQSYGDDDQTAAAARTRAAALRRTIAADADMGLWTEFERATKGHRMLTWAGTVRERLVRLTDIEERDAQEVVQEDDAVDTRAVLVQVTPEPWRTKVAAYPGRRGQLRVAVKVASDAATASGLDTEHAARLVVREVLEDWGLVWGIDIHGPDVDLDTGTITGERVVPTERAERRRHQWQTADDLDAGSQILGIRPRDAVRPEQAVRRAVGHRIARDLGAAAPVDDATPAAVPTGPCCPRCGDVVDPRLPRHLLC